MDQCPFARDLMGGMGKP